MSNLDRDYKINQLETRLKIAEKRLALVTNILWQVVSASGNTPGEWGALSTMRAQMVAEEWKR